MNWCEFEAEYRQQFLMMARKLYSRWPLPAGVGVDDVHQELWMGAWEAWNAFDATRGQMHRAAFSVCSARHRAMRWMHVQRGAHRRDGRAPGRFARNTDDYDFQGVMPTQDVAFDFKRALDRALTQARGHQRAALQMLIDRAFDLDRAARDVSTDGEVMKARRTMQRAYRMAKEMCA